MLRERAIQIQFFLQLPEMKRSAIHEVCLHAKMFAPGKSSVRQFLLNAPEPPSSLAIDRSLEFLEVGVFLGSSQNSTSVKVNWLRFLQIGLMMFFKSRLKFTFCYRL